MEPYLLDCSVQRRSTSVVFLFVAVQVIKTCGRRLNSVEDSAINGSITSRLGCPWGYTPEVEHLHMDFPGSVIGKSSAVYLLLNPHTPTLVVNRNSLWNFWRALDEHGTLSGEIIYDPRQVKGAASVPKALAHQKYNIVRDMVTMKFIKGYGSTPSKVVFKYECKDGERAAERRLGARRKGSRTRRRSTRRRRSRSAFIEEDGQAGVCSKYFVGGHFYPQKQVDLAMNKMHFERMRAVTAAKNKDYLSGTIKRQMKVAATESFTPMLARKALVSAKGGAIGFLSFIPGLMLLKETGIIFGPIGMIVGAVAALAYAGEYLPETSSAAEIMFNKLWCLAAHETCSGKPCFTRCYDNLRHPYLVPYGKPCVDRH